MNEYNENGKPSPEILALESKYIQDADSLIEKVNPQENLNSFIADLNSNPDPNPDANAETNLNPDADDDADTNLNPDPNLNPDADSDLNSNPIPDEDSIPDPNPDADPIPDPIQQASSSKSPQSNENQVFQSSKCLWKHVHLQSKYFHIKITGASRFENKIPVYGFYYFNDSDLIQDKNKIARNANQAYSARIFSFSFDFTMDSTTIHYVYQFQLNYTIENHDIFFKSVKNLDSFEKKVEMEIKNQFSRAVTRNRPPGDSVSHAAEQATFFPHKIFPFCSDNSGYSITCILYKPTDMVSLVQKTFSPSSVSQAIDRVLAKNENDSLAVPLYFPNYHWPHSLWIPHDDIQQPWTSVAFEKEFLIARPASRNNIFVNIPPDRYKTLPTDRFGFSPRDQRLSKKLIFGYYSFDAITWKLYPLYFLSKNRIPIQVGIEFYLMIDDFDKFYSSWPDLKTFQDVVGSCVSGVVSSVIRLQDHSWTNNESLYNVSACCTTLNTIFKHAGINFILLKLFSIRLHPIMNISYQEATHERQIQRLNHAKNDYEKKLLLLQELEDEEDHPQLVITESSNESIVDNESRTNSSQQINKVQAPSALKLLNNLEKMKIKVPPPSADSTTSTTTTTTTTTTKATSSQDTNKVQAPSALKLLNNLEKMKVKVPPPSADSTTSTTTTTTSSQDTNKVQAPSALKLLNNLEKMKVKVPPSSAPSADSSLSRMTTPPSLTISQKDSSDSALGPGGLPLN